MNANEAIVIVSDYKDEWYSYQQTCGSCHIDFMCSERDTKFCPGCGRKIIGRKQGNETVYYGKGDEDESNSNYN